jgi:hypothetical protein
VPGGNITFPLLLSFEAAGDGHIKARALDARNISFARSILLRISGPVFKKMQKPSLKFCIYHPQF